MANFLSKAANQNFSDTWNTVETGTNATQTTKTASTNTTTSFVYSPTFIITSGDTVDGVLLYLNRLNTTGTFSVALNDGSSDVKTVTVDAADLPSISTGGMVFFKFASSYTSATSSQVFKVGIKGSSSANAAVYRSSTAADWFKLLRKTATGSPAAADVLYVVGEHTGQGTFNSLTVTMDLTSATTTQWGDINLCSKGSLVWGTTASTNYALNLAGMLNNYENSTYSQGTSGTPMPSTCTYDFAFVNASNVDRGILRQGTFNVYGTPKTLQAKLLGATSTITNIALTTNVVTITTSAAHGLSTNDFVDIQISSPSANKSTIDGQYTVASTPSGTTFTYARTASNIASTSATGTVTKGVKSGATAGTLDSTPTNWKNGDTIAIASTTNSATACESVALSADVSTTSISFGATANSHNAASPCQAEVINTTQGCKIHGTSSSLGTYIDSTATTGQLNMQYVELYFMGSATANKRGIDIASNNYSLSYLSIRSQFSSGTGFITTVNASSGGLIDNCVYFGSFNNFFVNSAGSISGTITNNCALNSSASQFVYQVTASTSLTFTGNIAVGGSGGFTFSSGSVVSGNTINNNTAHSHSNGFNFAGFNQRVLGRSTFAVQNCTAWRCSASGITLGGSSQGCIVFDGGTIFGCGTGINISNVAEYISLKNITAHAGVTTTGTIGLQLSIATGDCALLELYNCDFGTPYTFSTADLSLGTGTNVVNVVYCSLASSTDISYTQGNLPWTGGVFIQSDDRVANSNRALKVGGNISIDTVIYETASPSERLTPSVATRKCESASKFFNIDSGTNKTINVKVRRSQVADAGGANYNGNQPRLIALANPAIGLTSDTVLATGSSGLGSWETLSGTISSPTANGQVEVIVDCDGTAGWVNVDSWSWS